LYNNELTEAVKRSPRVSLPLSIPSSMKPLSEAHTSESATNSHNTEVKLKCDPLKGGLELHPTHTALPSEVSPSSTLSSKDLACGPEGLPSLKDCKQAASLETTTCDGGNAEGSQGEKEGRQRGNHGKDTVAVLKEWLFSYEHVHHPYPNEQEKAELMAKTGLSRKQLSNWFTNARKRLWRPKQKAAHAFLRHRHGPAAYQCAAIQHDNPTAAAMFAEIPQVALGRSSQLAASFQGMNVQPQPGQSATAASQQRTLQLARVIANLPLSAPPRVVWGEEGEPLGIFFPAEESLQQQHQHPLSKHHCFQQQQQHQCQHQYLHQQHQHQQYHQQYQQQLQQSHAPKTRPLPQT
jgi:hypothetical protein